MPFPYNMTELQTLEYFFNHLDGTAWHYSSTPASEWLVGPNHCMWAFVTCSGGESGNVVGLTVPGGVGLSGKLPNLGGLVSLQILSLSDESIKAPHSWDWVCTHPALLNLDLSSNLISGGLPDCWTPNSPLQVLNLGQCLLTGNLPDSFIHLRVTTLQLPNNALSGKLPAVFGYNTNLQVCEGNWLRAIPPSLT